MGEHPAETLFNDISAKVEDRGGWGHGYRSTGHYQNYKLIYTAGFEIYEGKVESLVVRKRISLFRRKTLLRLRSQQPAMDGPKEIQYDAMLGCEAELEKLITALSNREIA